MAEKKNPAVKKKAVKKSEVVEQQVEEQTEAKDVLTVNLSDKPIEVNGGETAKEFVDRVKQDLDGYRRLVAYVNDIPTLQEAFNNVSVCAEEYAAVLNGRKYVLPESVDYDGNTYTLGQIASKVCHFIAQQSVKFSDVPTIKDICGRWMNPSGEMEYRIYNMTVGILNNCDYKGMREWEDILIVSAYMRQIGEQYTIDSFTESYWNTKKQILENRAKEIQSSK